MKIENDKLYITLEDLGVLSAGKSLQISSNVTEIKMESKAMAIISLGKAGANRIPKDMRDEATKIYNTPTS